MVQYDVDSLSPEKVILEATPEEKRERVKAALTTIIRAESFSGPLPPPKALKEYEEILPGSADRILSMAEKQSAHRMTLENKAIGGQVDQSRRGQLFGFIVFLFCIAVAILFAAVFDMKSFAAYFLTGTMVVLVALFISGKVSISKDLKNKSVDQNK